MESKDLQKLTDAIKGNTKALEKYTSIIDKQNQKIDALTMAISELKTTIKGNRSTRKNNIIQFPIYEQKSCKQEIRRIQASCKCD